ncbi:MAG: hypothetical protein JXR46_00090 [Calditrichaceae bacterium]|nr:hypothetical protein [Calditrichaceae bacterium]MBN2707411.1 hypothetical protein [Calditrichaceae bacterium]
MDLKTKLIIYLALLAIIDMIIPIPFTALLLIYVILNRPPWFIQYVNGIYSN